jgi:DNA-binding NarL/FixJ family response regulator
MSKRNPPEHMLLLIIQGATVKNCAEQLNLSAITVDNHKTRFMRKLNIHRTVDLVRLAIREQLVPS